MATLQLPLVGGPHRNQQLFSDYYLNAILPQRPDWQALAAEAAPTLDAIRGIYDRYTPSNNEAQTERELVRPVLEALRHTFEVQAPLQTPDGTKRPDYVFYRDAAALNANKNATLNEANLRPGGFAVGDAKAWDRALDAALKDKEKRPGSDPFSNKNPSYQIAFYVQHSSLECNSSDWPG